LKFRKPKSQRKKLLKRKPKKQLRKQPKKPMGKLLKKRLNSVRCAKKMRFPKAEATAKAVKLRCLKENRLSLPGYAVRQFFC
jgi:hypothetical protein